MNTITILTGMYIAIIEIKGWGLKIKHEYL